MPQISIIQSYATSSQKIMYTRLVKQNPPPKKKYHKFHKTIIDLVAMDGEDNQVWIDT